MQLATKSARCLLPRAAGPTRPQVAARRPWTAVRAQSTQQAEEEAVDDCATNINAYCSIDLGGRKPQSQMTLGEKEALFLEALSSFYFEGKPSISNEEFDLLKDELVWAGSKVAVLSSEEQRFLEAQRAYNAGRPLVTDAEFDAMKLKLRQTGSPIAAEGPRCSLRTRRMYSNAEVDYLKLVGINIPAALVVLGAVFSVDDLTGFEITKLIELPEPYGIVLLWGLVLPTVYVLATSITNLVFKDAMVLKAPCPNCGTETTTYFGDILTVSGSRDRNTVACGNCKATLVFDAAKREVVVEGEPPEIKPAGA